MEINYNKDEQYWEIKMNNGDTFTTSNKDVIDFICDLNHGETLEDFFGYSEEKREAIKEFIEESKFAIYELDREHDYQLVDEDIVEEYKDKLDSYDHNTRKVSVWDGDFESLERVKENRLPYDKVCAKKEAEEFLDEMNHYNNLNGYEDLSDLAKEVVKEWFRWNERYYDSNSDSIYNMEELEREYEEYGKEYSDSFDEFMEDYRLIDDDFLDGK